MKKNAHFRFRLYVAGHAPNSVIAIANLGAICREHLGTRHEIEIVDVLLHPKRALDDGVMLTPLLVRVSPAPICKIVGNLSHHESLRAVIGLPVLPI